MLRGAARERLQVREGEPPSRPTTARALPGVVARYFALDHPLAEICASLPNDPAMQAALGYCRGLRIMRQPPLGMSRHLYHFLDETGGAHPANFVGAAQAVWDEPQLCGTQAYVFPDRGTIARTRRRKSCATCGLGYRAKNLLATAQRVASGEADLESLARLCRTTNCVRSSARCRASARRWPIA